MICFLTKFNTVCHVHTKINRRTVAERNFDQQWFYEHDLLWINLNQINLISTTCIMLRCKKWYNVIQLANYCLLYCRGHRHCSEDWWEWCGIRQHVRIKVSMSRNIQETMITTGWLYFLHIQTPCVYAHARVEINVLFQFSAKKFRL